MKKFILLPCFILLLILCSNAQVTQFNNLELLQAFDPGLPSSGRTGSMLGQELSNIGDVNNDNFDDWAVGLYKAANASTSELAGQVYIYFGSNSITNEQDPDLILQGENHNSYFGWSVSGAGDVNNDGFDDVIVGAYGDDIDGSNTGKAFIYYGAATMDSIADVILSGVDAGDVFGYSVSSAGDVNNDGADDVIVGAYQNSESNTYTGSAHIYVGNSGDMDNEADIVLTSGTEYGYFGQHVSSAGDLNNDGFDDIVVQEVESNSIVPERRGTAYIYFGGSPMNNTADIIISGQEDYESFGHMLPAGDFDGDGYDDIMCAVSNSSYGRTYIYFGNSSMDTIADMIIDGTNYRGGLGAVSKGNVNGDAFDDLIFSELGQDKAHVLYGSASPDSVFDITFEGFYGSIDINRSILADFTSGDVNNDGFDDVIISAESFKIATKNYGRAYIYFGGTSMDSTADVIMTGEIYNNFGSCVSSVGDVNNDGYDDVIVGDNRYNNDYTGQAYIFLGGAAMDNIADLTFTGGSAMRLGISVSSAGDVNNDGFNDAIIGASGANSGEGVAYVYYGGDPMDNGADRSLSGNTSSHFFGFSVSSAGDVNGDTFDDVIVGAYGQDETAYIFFGGASMDLTADVLLNGEIVNEHFSVKVSSAGDINNDGYHDVIVGADWKNVESSNDGSAYIFLGGSEMDNQADILLSGESSGDYFGGSISYAGDFDNDGYDDVMVGASSNSGVGYVMGRAYIFAGDKIPPNAPRNLEATTIPDDGFVTLSWTHNLENDLSYYKIYRNTVLDFISSDSLDKVDSPDTSYIDANIINGTKYYYWVSAFSVNGEGPVSNVDSVRPNTTPIWSLPDTIFVFEDDTLYIDLDTLVYDSSDHDSTLYIQLTPSNEISETINNLTHVATITNRFKDFNGVGVIYFRVFDIDNAEDRDTVIIVVENTNDPPILSDLSGFDFTFQEDDSTYLLFSSLVTDIDNSISEISITASALESTSMNFRYDPETTYGYFIPMPDSNGVFTMIVTATDPDLAFDTDTVVYTVSPVNDYPEIVNPLPDTLFITEDDADIILISDISQVFHDADGELLSFSVEYWDSSVTFSIVNDTLFATPDPDFYTPYSGIVFDIYAADILNYTAYQRITLWIEGINDPPLLDSLIPDITIAEDQYNNWFNDIVPLYSYFRDIEDHSLEYEIESTGGGIVAQSDGNYIEIKTLADSFGIYPIVVTAIDDSLASVSDTFNITVQNVNDAPTTVYNEIIMLHYPEDTGTLIITDLDTLFLDIDNEELFYTLILDGDEGINVTIMNDSLQLSTPQDVNGFAALSIWANDGLDSVRQMFYLYIDEVNDPPYFVTEMRDTTFNEDAEIEILLSEIFEFVEDVDNDVSYFDEDNLTITSNTISSTMNWEKVAFTAPENWFGKDTITVIVDDGYLSDTTSFIVTIASVNDPPIQVIPISPGGITVNSLDITFLWHSTTDIEDDPVSYIIIIENSSFDTLIAGLSDTTLLYNGNSSLQYETTYYWCINATDGVDTATCMELYFYTPQGVGVDFDLEEKERFLIRNYPNPFSDVFTLEVNFKEFTSNGRIEVFNELGIKVYSKELKIDNLFLKQDFNLSSYSDGIYLLRLVTERGARSMLIQKQK